MSKNNEKFIMVMERRICLMDIKMYHKANVIKQYTTDTEMDKKKP